MWKKLETSLGQLRGWQKMTIFLVIMAGGTIVSILLAIMATPPPGY